MKQTSVFLVLLTLTLLVALIYSNSLNVPFQFDDVKRIADIKAAQDINPKEILQYSKSRFFLYLTFSFNYFFGKHNVFTYHFLNLLLHLLNSWLVFFLCLLIFNSPKLNKTYPESRALVFSFFAAMIFAVHPLQTESVTYIWQRAESMAGGFYLLSLYLYARLRIAHINKRGNKLLYVLCLISIIFSSLTKPTSVTLPIAIFMYEVCFLSKDLKELKRNIGFLVPILVLTILPILLARYDAEENKDVAIRLNSAYLPYYYTKLRVLANAIRLFILPINQKLEYDFIWSTSLIKPISTLCSFVLLASLAVMGVFSFKRYPLAAFIIGWFYLTLSVTTLLFLDDIFFEHYLYLPLLSYSIGVPILSLSLADKAKIGKGWAITGLVVLVAIYSMAAYNRNKVWQTEISLWEDTVKKSPYKARPHYTLGVYYFKSKRYNEAFNQYMLALKYKPAYPEAYYRLGEYCFNLGDIDRAIVNYKKAVEINPEFFEAHLNLGAMYFNIKRYEDARYCFNEALRFTKDPGYIAKIQNTLKEMEHYE